MLSPPSSRRSLVPYVALLVILAAYTFGDLSGHLLDSDDFEYLADATAARTDVGHFLSPERTMTGRPLVELMFLGASFVWGNDPGAHHMLVALHLVASMLLARVVYRLGADLDLSLASGLLFLVNVAHFRAVQWISCVAYPLALVLALLAILSFVRHLRSGRLWWLAGSCLALGLAICSHPAAVSIAPFCAYLHWRNNVALREFVRSSGTLVTVALACGLLLYALHLNATQLKELTSSWNPSSLGLHFIDYLGQLFASSHWLPHDLAGAGSWPWLNRAAGMLVATGLIIVLFRRQHEPITVWIVWLPLTLIPFMIREPVGSSRYLYLASAGSSVVLAWSLRAMVQSCQKWLSVPSRRALFSAALGALTISSVFALKRAEAVAYYHSGRSYIARGEIETGVAQLRKGVAHHAHILPEDTYRRLCFGAFLAGQSPREVLEQAKINGNGSAEVEVLLGVSAFQESDPRRWQRGEQIYHALLGAEDQSPLRRTAATAIHNIGWHALYELGDHERAVTLFRRALDLYAAYPNALVNLGNACSQQGRVDRAAEAYRAAMKIQPDYAPAYQNLAIIKLNQGEIKSAKVLLQRATQLDSGPPEPWYLLARTLRLTGDLAAADAALQRALAANPIVQDYWKEYFNIAAAYHRKGELSRAFAIYRQVMKAVPNDARVYHNIDSDDSR